MVKLKLSLSACVVKEASFLCSWPPFVAVSTGARHARHAASSDAHSRNADDEEVLLIISKASKSGDPGPKASPDDR